MAFKDLMGGDVAVKNSTVIININRETDSEREETEDISGAEYRRLSSLQNNNRIAAQHSKKWYGALQYSTVQYRAAQ